MEYIDEENKKGWCGGITCKCGSKNVKVGTDLEEECDGTHMKYYKTTYLKCGDCGNNVVYDRKELKIIDQTDEYTRFVEL